MNADKFGIHASGKERDFSDITSWSEAERLELVTKSNLFPNPDYRKLHEQEGVPKEALWVIRCVREAIPDKPKCFATSEYIEKKKEYENAKREWRKNETPENKQKVETLAAELDKIGEEITLQRQQEYIAQVSAVREWSKAVRTEEDMIKFQQKIESVRRMNSVTQLGKATEREYSYFGRSHRIQDDMEEKKFLFSKDERFFANHVIQQYDGQNVKPISHFPTVWIDLEEKHGWYQTFVSAPDEAKNPENWQEGTYFVVDRKKKELLGFNFPTKEEAKDFLLSIRESKEKQPEPKPKKRLIPEALTNVVRIGEDYRSGKPVSTQEMLDEFGFLGGKFSSRTIKQERQEHLNKSYDACKDMSGVLGIECRDISLNGQMSVSFGTAGRGSTLAYYDDSKRTIHLTEDGAGSFAHEWGHALDAYISRQLGFPQSFCTDVVQDNNPLNEVLSVMQKNPNGSETDFYRNAVLLDQNHSCAGNQNGCYWHSNTELFARAFACYIKDKLEEKGNRNDYLCGHAESTVLGYPVGEERERINQAIDNLIEQCKDRGLLHRLESKQKEQSAEKETEPEIDADLYEEYERISGLISYAFPDLEFDIDLSNEHMNSKEDVSDMMMANLLTAINQEYQTEFYLQYGFVGSEIMTGFGENVMHFDSEHFSEAISILRKEIGMPEIEIEEQKDRIAAEHRPKEEIQLSFL